MLLIKLLVALGLALILTIFIIMKNNFFSILKKVDDKLVHTIKAKGTLYEKLD